MMNPSFTQLAKSPALGELANSPSFAQLMASPQFMEIAIFGFGKPDIILIGDSPWPHFINGFLIDECPGSHFADPVLLFDG